MVTDLSRRAFAGALASFSTGGCASAQPANAAFQNALREARTRHDLPGLAAAVIRGGRVSAIGVDGVRQVGTAEALEIGDRFHIASCTKSMTATLAAIAVRRGLLDWSTTLGDCVPELGGAADYRGATLQQLLAHAARMPAYTSPSAEQVAWMRALPGPPSEQRLAFLHEVLAHEPPNDATGDGAYSNVGYVAACAMLERLTGAAWEDWIQRELAAPLGMRSVGFGYPASAEAPHQPRGHALVDGRVEVLPFDPSRELAVCLHPAGAVHASIGDLARHTGDHLDGLVGRRALLPQSFYTQLHSQLPGSTSAFTLGWGVRDDERLGRLHFGAGSGGWFFVRIFIAPEHDVAAVVASNSGDAAAATRELAQQLMT
jgi:CubicO group peptidase (beta-lactamase class C family)